LSLYRSQGDLIEECDREIEKLVAAFEPRVDPDEKPMPEDRKQKQRKRKKKSGSADFNLRAEAYQLLGVDLTQIPGLMTLVFLLSAKWDETGLDGPQPRISFPGWDCAPTTTSAEERCCGEALAEPRTARELCSDWRLTRCIAIRHRWATISAAGKQTRSGRRHHRDSAQDRDHLLHDGEQAGRVRHLALGEP
jgi:hypothetical protein